MSNPRLEDDGVKTRSAAKLPAHIESQTLEPGLYLVSTPIGRARDITLRALDVLNSADALAAEDTRVLRHLLSIHGVPLRGRKIISHHDHSTERQTSGVLNLLRQGKSLALCSDAGTPLIADPGYKLARTAADEGLVVHAVPGPSSVLAALCLAGLPSDRFLFAGFVPGAKAARATWLKQWTMIDATVIVFENPRRVKASLEELCRIDPDRAIVVARELTKKFEEVIRGTAEELAAHSRMDSLKGEVVIIIDRAGGVTEVNPEDVLRLLDEKLAESSVKDAAREVAEALGLPRREVYQTALSRLRPES